MGVVDVEIVVGGGGADAPRVHIHAGEDAALTGVVADAAAGAHLHDDVGDGDVPVHIVGDDAHGVDAVGVEAGHVGVLDELVLQHHQLVLADIGQHGVGGRKIRHPQALHTAAAVAVVDLGEDVLLPRRELCHLPGRGGLAIQRLAAQEAAERLVEPQLVVEIVVEGGIVHQVGDLPVAHAGEIGVPLFAGEVVEPVHGVVIVPRTVAGGAPEDVEERADLALSALVLDDAQNVVHFLPPHAGEDAGDVLDVGHGKRSFPMVSGG